MKKAIGAFLLATTLAITTAACEVPEDDGTTAADRAEVNTKKKDKKPAETKEADGPTETAGQENARKKAAEYLDYSAFSREGLIKQLEFEGFSNKDAVYGVDAQKADWNKQAAAKAAEYLDMSSFSRQGLIEQLEFEGFTRAQAEYGAKKVGL